ncbi:MAG: hypothetical protein NC548_54650, partial [Lachnospiraceae bacterium]|nr:hypothetical protein [Lachnospiraceae bacterium]
MDKNINDILEEIDFIKSVYEKLILELPNFKITDESLLPYGLKPHTRSVSWLVEQVINQQSKIRAKQLGVLDVDFDLPDTCLHDCIITDLSGRKHFVNIKVHNADGHDTRNDIAAVEKLYKEYISNDDYNVFYVCFGIRFDNVNILFDRQYLEVFSVQFLPIYVNPRNDKIQALYKHVPEYRNREDFLKLLEEHSTSIVLNRT